MSLLGVEILYSRARSVHSGQEVSGDHLDGARRSCCWPCAWHGARRVLSHSPSHFRPVLKPRSLTGHNTRRSPSIPRVESVSGNQHLEIHSSTAEKSRLHSVAALLSRLAVLQLPADELLQHLQLLPLLRGELVGLLRGRR